MKDGTTSKLDMYWVKVQNRVSQEVGFFSTMCGQFWKKKSAKKMWHHSIKSPTSSFLWDLHKKMAVRRYPFFKRPSEQIPSKWFPSEIVNSDPDSFVLLIANKCPLSSIKVFEWIHNKMILSEGISSHSQKFNVE